MRRKATGHADVIRALFDLLWEKKTRSVALAQVRCRKGNGSGRDWRAGWDAWRGEEWGRRALRRGHRRGRHNRAAKSTEGGNSQRGFEEGGDTER